MKKFTFALFLMISTMAGAAVLGFPYAFADLGFWTGTACLTIVMFVATLMTLYIAETTLRTKETFHLSGFAKKYFGDKCHTVVLAIEVLALYSAIIAYLTAIGLALTNLFSGSPLIWGSLFFVAASPLIYLGVTRFDKSEAFISGLKLFTLVALIAIFLPYAKSSNLGSFNPLKILQPFGIVLFACLSYTVIPQLERIYKKDLKKIVPVILTSSILVFGLYVLFSYTFLGTLGNQVSEIATIGLSSYHALGSFYVILATATPFIALSIAVRNVYVVDAKFNKKLSWLLASFIPFIVYLNFNFGFVKFLQISGGLFGSAIGFFSGALVLKARKKSRKKPAFVVPGGKTLVYTMMAIFTVGFAYQLYHLLI